MERLRKYLNRLAMFAVLIPVIALSGCEEAHQEQVKFESDAIKSVQEAKSIVPGVTCLQFMSLAVSDLESKNHYVKIGGWMAYHEPGHATVIFKLDDNEKPLEFKWYIENGNVIPVNELAQGAMTRQKAKYL
jgi:hypothetical protein